MTGMPAKKCCCVGKCVNCTGSSATHEIKVTIAGLTGASAAYNGVYILPEQPGGNGDNDQCEWNYSVADYDVRFQIQNNFLGIWFRFIFAQNVSPFHNYSIRSNAAGPHDTQVDCGEIPAMPVVVENGFGTDFDAVVLTYEWL